MSLTQGTHLGPYEILSPLGVGGMGEVYRARDTKLNRDVALKLMPDVFAHDAERVARFTREAQTLASLNHPNIAQIYGIVEAPSPGGGADHLHAPLDAARGAMSGSRMALVMELVDGEDLSALIARGAIPLTEALPLARQIADALEAAHEQGIVHRDLKPANIKVRPDGTVKVLDFGLAKAIDAAGSSSSGSVANSPTLTARATALGLIIGTAAYMAPEQARGKAVDRRADIWAFGVVLYEMLTGRRAFEGNDVSDVLAAVLRQEIDWSVLPADAPPSVRRLLRRCLTRDPRQRLSAIGDARLEMADSEAADSPGGSTVAAPAPATASLPWRRRAAPWGVAALLGVALLATLAAWSPWHPAPIRTPRRLLVDIGTSASMPANIGASAVLSPDGSTLAFVALQGSQTSLFVRKLDQLQATPLVGTEHADLPFFSPDGRWIAFFDGAQLKKVQATGGAAVALCQAKSARGGTWAEDDTIIFMPASAANTALQRVPATGGTPADFVALSPGAVTQRWPQALPGAKAVLYTENAATNGFDNANLLVAPLAGGPPKLVVRGAYSGRFVPSGTARGDRNAGHLIYVQQGSLLAAPFDLAKLEVVGPAVPVLEAFGANPTTGGAQVAFGGDGTLVYVPGTTATAANPIEWMTRDGRTSPLRTTPSNWANPRFSPDGQKLALDVQTGAKWDIWIYEPGRDRMTQLTFDKASSRCPVWSPDGKRIAFASDRGRSGIPNLYVMNADGSGDVTRLTDSPDSQIPNSWHPGGKILAFVEMRASTLRDIMLLPLETAGRDGIKAGTPNVFLGTPADEWGPVFSPDGRWLAYLSNELGNNETFVRPFPGPGGKWRISPGGAFYPRWSMATHELLFLSPSLNKVYVVSYTASGDSFNADPPKPWSPIGYVTLAGNAGPYDIHPDGKRLALIAARGQEVAQDKVVLFFNFFDYLWTVAPVRK